MRIKPDFSVLEAQRTTLADFEVMRMAYQYRQLDQEYMASFIAWQIARILETDKKGKPKIKRFEKLYDLKKEEREVRNPSLKSVKAIDKEAMRLAAFANKKQKGG